jgi:hypothetical protein
MHRSASSAIAAAGILSCALFLGACGQGNPGASPSPGTSSPRASSPTTSASPTTTASSSGTAAAWTKYTTSDGTLSFEYPAGWTIKEPAGPVPPSGGVFVGISNAKNKQVATLRTNMVTGSECTEKHPYSVLDSQPLPALAQGGTTPRFTFESRMDSSATDPAKMNQLAYGITSVPEPTGTEACPIFHFFTWPPSGAMFGGAYDPLDTSGGGSPGVDTPEAYMQTQEYKDIKRMITSLKPAS